MELWLLVVLCLYTELNLVASQHYLNEFAVKIDKNVDINELARTHGFQVLRQIRGLDDVYVLQHQSVPHRSKRSAIDVAEVLQQDPRIKYAEQQKTLKRTKRTIVHDKQWELPIKHYDDKSVYQRFYEQDNRLQAKDNIPIATKIKEAGFKDPYFSDQWYLINEGQTGGTPGYDVNVLPVWKKGFTGRGVVVSILDDGIDHTHPDLEQNYDPEASGDINDRSDKENDPMPDTKKTSNSHGTRCAGEVAAQANNSYCGVGIAFNAKIGGVRMLDGKITDSLEAEALTYHNQHIDIYSASWGPSDDGKTMEGPGIFAEEALEKGIKEGRGGKGSIFVWATGNGGIVDDDCSCDGYVSSIYTLSIGCISDHGLSTYFSEVCPSTMAVIFTGGSHLPPGEAHKDDKPHIKVVTTDLNGECTLEFQGTSSAAPLAAGCFALVLEANPNLTWRDVQHIVVQTARVPNAEEEGWTLNGAGYHVNNKFGFGAIDCGKMVEVAQTWTNVSPQHRCVVPSANAASDILRGQTINQTLYTDGCKGDQDHSVGHLEHTQVHISLTHQKRGDLSINLYSPAGTRSEVLSVRPLDENTEGIEYTFMTVHNWGENPQGDWTLSVSDHSDKTGIYNVPGDHHKVGVLKNWSLILWGSADGAGVDSDNKRVAHDESITDPAHEVEEEELEHIMAEEEHSSQRLHIKSPSTELSDEDWQLLSDLVDDDDKDAGKVKGHEHLTRQAYLNVNDDYEEQAKRVLASLSFQDQATLRRLLDDKPVSRMEYVHFLHHLDQGVQAEREKHYGYQETGVNLQQRSLLDKALAQILPPKVTKKATTPATTTTTTTTTTPPHASQVKHHKEYEDINRKTEKYRDIIVLINKILPLLNENRKYN